jgi:hypothetical protein
MPHAVGLCGIAFTEANLAELDPEQRILRLDAQSAL